MQQLKYVERKVCRYVRDELAVWGIIAHLHTLHRADFQGGALNLAAFRWFQDRPALNNRVLVALTAHDTVSKCRKSNEFREFGEISGNSRPFEHGIEKNRAFGPFWKVLHHEFPAFLSAPKVSRGGGRDEDCSVALRNRTCQDFVEPWCRVDHRYVVISLLVHKIDCGEIAIAKMADGAGGGLLGISIQDRDTTSSFFQGHGKKECHCGFAGSTFLITECYDHTCILYWVALCILAYFARRGNSNWLHINGFVDLKSALIFSTVCKYATTGVRLRFL